MRHPCHLTLAAAECGHHFKPAVSGAHVVVDHGAEEEVEEEAGAEASVLLGDESPSSEKSTEYTHYSIVIKPAGDTGGYSPSRRQILDNSYVNEIFNSGDGGDISQLTSVAQLTPDQMERLGELAVYLRLILVRSPTAEVPEDDTAVSALGLMASVGALSDLSPITSFDDLLSL